MRSFHVSCTRWLSGAVVSECLKHAFDGSNQLLWEACASVGISQNRSTEQVLRDYINQYHYSGYKIIIK